MVSTRGIKPKFELNERVLCYEPDPKKIKMLYDARIISVKPASDEKGKKHFEYFIHFQGWNSSWDRDVEESLLLKDNEESRQEQTALYQQTDEYRQRMERKKKRKVSDKIRTSTESADTGGERSRHSTAAIDGYSPEEADNRFQRYGGRLSIARSGSMLQELEEEANAADQTGVEPNEQENGEDDHEEEEKEEDEESDRGEDAVEVPVINLPDLLKERLEGDMRAIQGGKLVRLPAQPNVVSLLEGFVRSFAISKLSNMEKVSQKQQQKSQYRLISNPDKSEADRFEEVLTAIKISKEVAEGVRILIDFHLGNVLLYPQEQGQFKQSSSIRPHMEIMERLVAAPQAPAVAPTPPASSARIRKSTGAASSCDSIEEGGSLAKKQRGSARKKESESEAVPSAVHAQGSVGSAASVSSGTATPIQGAVALTPQIQYPQSKKSHQVLRELYTWKLVPESVYFEEPVPVSLIYGGIHLVRLMVRIPDIFARMRFTEAKLKLVLKYIDALVEYLNTQPDLFSESSYCLAS